MKQFKFIIIITCITNCIYSMDRYIPKKINDQYQYSIKAISVSANCSDKESNLVWYRKVPFEKEFLNQMNLRNNVMVQLESDKPNIDKMDFSLLWRTCEYATEIYSEEEKEEVFQSQLQSIVGISSLGLFPVFVITRSHINIVAESNGQKCETIQPVRIGGIAHLFYLPLAFNLMKEDMNREILKPAISRGIDDIFEKYNNGQCKIEEK
jgi:hypothetical protein